MGKHVTKRGPWLEDWYYDWITNRRDGVPWFCIRGLEDYWDVEGAYRIRICGSTRKQPGTIGAIEYTTPASRKSWQYTEDGTIRLNQYSNWLKSFNSPVVYIWIERWDQ